MAQGAHEELSARELEILEAVVTGATNQQIALSLHVSVNTVKAHLRNIFEKLGVQSRTEATLRAIQRGLVSVPTPVQAEPHAPPAPPEIPAAHTLVLPLQPLQRFGVMFALLLMLAIALWPTTRAAPTSADSPLIDAPQSARVNGTPTVTLRWQTRASLPTARARLALAELDGVLYAIGGLGDDGATPRVDAYDADRDRWERRADKPTAVANAGAVALDGHIYVPGGNDADNRVLALMEVYDPASDTWSQAAALPAPLCAYAIAATRDGFYLFGGWDGQRYLDTTYYYDLTSDSWQPRAPLPGARGFAAAATVGERIYLLGGRDADGDLDLCQSYDPALDAANNIPWHTHAPMSTRRSGHGLAAYGGALYVVGGGWGSYVAYNERYALEGDAWSTFESPLSGEWRSLGLAAIEGPQGSFLYAVGGWNGAYLNTVRAYQISFRAFIPVQ